MRIVHICTYASVGGASKATYRIHKKLLERGIESDVLVLHGATQSFERVTQIPNDFLYRLKDYFFLRFDHFFFRRHLRKDALPFSFNFFPRVSIHNHPLVRKADIVCLYWVGANLLTPGEIGRINKPVVWRFSDKWAFTGGCHLSGDCTRYEDQCGNCPQLVSGSRNDITHKGWKQKYNAWKNKNITVVAPSSWMEWAAGSSSIFKDKSIVRIPTGVDQNVFSPANKKEAKRSLRIPPEKRTILFGANNPFRTSYKGGEFFRKLSQQLSKENYVFLVFGVNDTQAGSLPENIISLGELKKEEDMANAYNAADIFISPSAEDNLPNTVLEAMSCGTPCIAFNNSGGVEDVIEHKMNGYLAAFKNVDDLIEGVSWIFDADKEGAISTRAREKIIGTFTLDKQADSFINLYKSILSATSPKE